MLQGLHIVYDLVQHYCHTHRLQNQRLTIKVRQILIRYSKKNEYHRIFYLVTSWDNVLQAPKFFIDFPSSNLNNNKLKNICILISTKNEI